VIERILAAVDDSPAGLAAARLAVDVAGRYRTGLRFVHVLGDGAVASALSRPDDGVRVAQRRDQAATALLWYVAGLARSAGVSADTRQLEGEPARRILDEARDWPAGLVVIGRSGQRGPGAPYMGRETRHVLEFAEQPVLVVPPGP
jgi:nucleotide-binding universal stress UspA family protein